jgi:hypothetical protein
MAEGSADCRLLNADLLSNGRMQNAECRMPNAECRMPNGIPGYRGPTAMSNATDDPSFGIPHSTINLQSAIDNQQFTAGETWPV